MKFVVGKACRTFAPSPIRMRGCQFLACPPTAATLSVIDLEFFP